MTRRPSRQGKSRDGLFWNLNGQPEIRDNPLVRACTWPPCRALPGEPCTHYSRRLRRRIPLKETDFHPARKADPEPTDEEHAMAPVPQPREGTE